MDRHCRSAVISTVVLLGGLIASLPARAFDVMVSAAPSANGTFVGGVWTPTAISTLSFVDGTPKSAVTDANGDYAFSVSAGWSGTVTPSLPPNTFVPVSRTYSGVTTNRMGQDYALGASTVPTLGGTGLALLGTVLAPSA